MRKFTSRLSALMLVVIMIMSMCMTTAFAAMTDFSDEEMTYMQENFSKFDSYFSDDAQYNANPAITVDDGSGNTTTYYVKDEDSWQEAKDRVTYLKRRDDNQSLSSEKINDLTDGLQIEADTTEAVNTLSGLSGFINLFLGLATVITTLLMAVYTAADVIYIAFPVFRNKCDEAKATGGNSAMTRQTASGETKLRFVTDEAQRAVVKAQTEGTSPWGTYMKNRVFAYIMVTIILVMFLTGNINIITNLALTVVEGIMNVLAGLQL